MMNLHPTDQLFAISSDDWKNMREQGVDWQVITGGASNGRVCVTAPNGRHATGKTIGQALHKLGWKFAE